MKKFMLMSLTATMLCCVSSMSYAQWCRYGSCSNGQCGNAGYFVPVETSNPVEPCKPVEKYIPFEGEQIPLDKYVPGQMTAQMGVEQTTEAESKESQNGGATTSTEQTTGATKIEVIIARQERECSLLAAVNRARARFGLRPCMLDARLASRAQNISRANARAGYLFHSPGAIEIIATNSWGSEDYLVQQWLNSPGHRRLLLGNYRYIGVGTTNRGNAIFGACQFSNRASQTVETTVLQQTCSNGQCSLQSQAQKTCSTCSRSTCSRSYSRAYSRRGLFGWRCCGGCCGF